MRFNMMRKQALDFLCFEDNTDCEIIKITSSHSLANSGIVNELRNKIKSFSENEKFLVLLMDDDENPGKPSLG